MAIVAGINEAGYGPVLGPLVVSAVAFDVPDELVGESMWSLLAPTVAKKASRRTGPLVIADSKKLYANRSERSLARLERGVLAALAAMDAQPGTLQEFLARVAPGALEAARDYPWYWQGALVLPRCAGATDVSLTGNALSVALAGRGMRLIDLRSEVLFAGQFNRLVAATRNKSTTLFDVTCRLLMRLWQMSDGGILRVYVDRQGGRVRYRAPLQRLFEGCRLRVLEQTQARSAYEISGDRRGMELCFQADAEDKQMPVALASMASKYIRELFLQLLNCYWARIVQGIKPTAGYYVDGRRFFGLIEPELRRMGIAEELILRSR